jgi:adenosine deaminase
MSTASFIAALPKVELNVQLEGAFQLQTLKNIAEQNDIPETLKRYSQWFGLIEQPEYPRINEIARMAASWLKHSDDLTRVVYDLGTTLAKQNVRYAEVGVNPALFPDITANYDDFLAAINDGRDRAKRAWQIDMAWIFVIPREEPRRADELARWTTTASARRGGVIGLGLSGDENAQPVGQFARAFQTVEKKDVAKVARAGDAKGADGVLKAIEELRPSRILDGWGAAGSDEAIKALVDGEITLAVNLTRAQKQGWATNLADYPLRKLYDAGVSLVIGADMPSLYRTNISAEYLAVVEKCGFSFEELENLGLNAVRTSFLPEEAKAEMVKTFTQAYTELRAEHIEAITRAS